MSGLPAFRQSVSQAEIDRYVDLPALKQTLHFVWQGMHSAASVGELRAIRTKPISAAFILFPSPVTLPT